MKFKNRRIFKIPYGGGITTLCTTLKLEDKFKWEKCDFGVRQSAMPEERRDADATELGKRNFSTLPCILIFMQSA